MTKIANVENFDLSLGDSLKSILAKAVNSENHKQPKSHETLRDPSHITRHLLRKIL